MGRIFTPFRDEFSLLGGGGVSLSGFDLIRHDQSRLTWSKLDWIPLIIIKQRQGRAA